MSETSEGELPASEEHRYFRAIEAFFIELRGAPLLLSPGDWRVARAWYRAGIPLDVVQRALAEMFAKRRERGATGGVSTLRYCIKAVEAAWTESQELGAAAASSRPETGLDLTARLSALAAALPADLPERERWAAAIVDLAAGGGSEATEAALEQLDQDLVAALLAGLDEATAGQLTAEADAALARLGRGLADDERARARERLVRERLRRKLGLPVLSLFAPEAVG